jgi:micrococcal nuclease
MARNFFARMIATFVRRPTVARDRFTPIQARPTIRSVINPRRPREIQPSQSSDRLTEVQVKRVIDGDTIDVRTSNGDIIRVRLDAIDCPEDGQEWGNKATIGLIQLVGGRWVYLELHGTDNYGRTLATVYVMDGSELINVNEQMVRCGHAWVEHMYTDHLSKNRRRQLIKLERWAKAKPVGLWKLENSIPPWEWRNNKRSA